MKITKPFFNLIVLLVLAQGALAAKSYTPFSKTLSAQKEVKTSADISLSHRYGDVLLSTWSNSAVKVEVKVTGKIKDEEELENLYEELMRDLIKANDHVFIKTNIERYNSSVIQLGTKTIANNDMEFVNGEKFKVSDFKMQLKVFVPQNHRLALNTRYHDLTMDDYSGDLSVSQYNGTFTAGELRGDCNISAKYGAVNVGNARFLKLSSYDGDVRIGDVDRLTISSKYSNIYIGKCNDINSDSYDDNITLGNLNKLKITSKYSSIAAGNLDELTADIYDGRIDFGNATRANIKSQYSQLKMGVIGSLTMFNSYDNDFTIELVDQFLVQNSKYSTYRIKAITGKLTLNSYDDNVRVGLVSETASSVNLKMKYGSYSFRLHKDYQHQLQVNSKSTDIDFPKEHYKITSESTDECCENDVNMDAQTTGYSGGNMISIDAYSCDIQLGLN